MFWSEYHRDVMNLAMDILGMEGQILTGTGDEATGDGLLAGAGRADYPVSDLQASFFFSPLRDHLGRHRRDPAQHRGRAGPRPAEGAADPPPPEPRQRPGRRDEAQATPSSVAGLGLRRLTAGHAPSIAAVLVAVPQPGHRRGHHRGRPRPTQERHARARGLRDPTHQRRADRGGAQEADGVERHDPARAWTAPTRSWMVALAVAMKAIESRPMGTSSDAGARPGSATAPQPAIRTPKAMPTAVSRWMLGLPRLATTSPPTTAPPAMSDVSAEKVPAPPWNVSWASRGRIDR